MNKAHNAHETSCFKIDEVMIIDDVKYWCNAVLKVEWSKHYRDTDFSPDKAFVDDLRLYGYDSLTETYEVDLSDPTLLNKAKDLSIEWALENAELE